MLNKRGWRLIIFFALIMFPSLTEALKTAKAGEPMEASATPNGTGLEIGRGVTVRLAKPSVLLGEPVELVFRLASSTANKSSWPDFLGGNSPVKVTLQDASGAILTEARFDRRDFFIGIDDRGEARPRQRATLEAVGDDTEAHIWLSGAQIPFTKAGTYSIVVGRGKAVAIRAQDRRKRGWSYFRPWKGPMPVVDAKGNEVSPKMQPKKAKEIASVPPKSVAPPLSERKAVPIERDEIPPVGGPVADAKTMRVIREAVLPIQVIKDSAALTKRVQALRYKINNTQSYFDRHDDETGELFSMTGPEARLAQQALADDALTSSLKATVLDQTLARIGTSEVVDFLADQIWKRKKDWRNPLSTIYYFGSPRTREKIESLYHKHGEEIPSPVL